MNKEQKHHYIPQFYLKQWGGLGSDRRLYVYSKRYRGIEVRATYPAGTGYVRGLYRFNALEKESQNSLEESFLLKADNRANIALQHLLKRDLDLNEEIKSAWSRFIMTLIYRNPEAMLYLKTKIERELPLEIAKLNIDWSGVRREHDPLTKEDYIKMIPVRDNEQAMVTVHTPPFLASNEALANGR